MRMTQLIPQLVTGVAIDLPFLLIVFVLLWINGGPVVLAPVAGIAALIAVHHWTNIGSDAEQKRSMALTQLQSNRLNEAVEMLEMIKSTRTELRVLNRFERIFDEFAYSSHVSRLWQSLAAYANVTIGQLMIAIVLIIGAYEISAGNITVGGLLTCSLLVGRIIAPIGQLVGSFHRASQSRRPFEVAGGRNPVRKRKCWRRQRRVVRSAELRPSIDRHLVLLFSPGIATDRRHIGDDPARRAHRHRRPIGLRQKHAASPDRETG